MIRLSDTLCDVSCKK